MSWNAKSPNELAIRVPPLTKEVYAPAAFAIDTLCREPDKLLSEEGGRFQETQFGI